MLVRSDGLSLGNQVLLEVPIPLVPSFLNILNSVNPLCCRFRHDLRSRELHLC